MNLIVLHRPWLSCASDKPIVQVNSYCCVVFVYNVCVYCVVLFYFNDYDNDQYIGKKFFNLNSFLWSPKVEISRPGSDHKANSVPHHPVWTFLGYLLPAHSCLDCNHVCMCSRARRACVWYVITSLSWFISSQI